MSMDGFIWELQMEMATALTVLRRQTFSKGCYEPTRMEASSRMQYVG